MMNTGTYEPTDEWLEQINEEFRRNDVPHKKRPWDAWMEWSKYAGVSSSLGDEDVKKIFDWFERNTKADSQKFGPIYEGSFYYDSCFWPISIPVVIGHRIVAVDKYLRTMPNTIKTRLLRDREIFAVYLAVCVACIDYGFGIEEVGSNNCIGLFAQELLRSGNQQLTATVTLLHEKNPNPKAVESSRMATEMFLKAFLASRAGLTERVATVINHNLEEALERCLNADNHSELQAIGPELKCFPGIGNRYKGTDKTPSELWQAYAVAQFTGTTVIRSLTGRDGRKTIE